MGTDAGDVSSEPAAADTATAFRHRVSTSDCSSSQPDSSEPSTLCEDARLDSLGSPDIQASSSVWKFWNMNSTSRQNGRIFEESASLLNDPGEKVAEIELKESSASQTTTLESASASVQGIYRSPRAFGRTILRGLVPSFISTRYSGEQQKAEKLYPTAYLDGLRGIAAFAVCLCHLSYTVFSITVGYGETHERGKNEEGEIGGNDRIIQLPFLRLIYSGPPMVAIFFVISGYALSNKPIKQMRARQHEGLLGTMCSSIFRRPFRLFLPCFASTFIVFVLLRLGFYELTRPIYENKELFRNVDEAHLARFDSFWLQLYEWLAQMWDFVHPWDWFIFGGSTIYDRHLWTIPVEFRASLVLFLSLVMVAKFKAYLRMLTFAALGLWALRWDRWEMVLFWSGALFAELDQVKAAQAAKDNELPTANGHSHTSSSKASIRSPVLSQKLWSSFWLANFICALYLCSYPDQFAKTTPGFQTLAYLIPKWYTDKIRFWQSIGAIQLVWACTNAKFLQNLFNGPVIQYIGKISYALYLMHGPVIHTFGWGMMGLFWKIFGSDTRTKWEAGFACGAILTIPMIIWAADIFWRAVDIPCVKCGRWLESKVTVAVNGR